MAKRDGPGGLWLDLEAPATGLLEPGQRLDGVSYFTARLRNNLISEQRQDTYLQALAARAQRLSAFFDAILDIATRNLALMAAYDHALTTQEPAAGHRQDSPIYLAWHAHVASLIREARPDLDADLLGHILFGALHTDLVRRGESKRLAKTLRQLVDTLLGEPGDH